MRALLTIVNLYMLLVIAWAIMTWIPGVAGGPLHNAVGMPVVPVLNLFSFARVGAVGFQAMILVFALIFVQRWLERRIAADERAQRLAEGNVSPEDIMQTGASAREKNWWEDLEEEKREMGERDTR